LRLGHRRVSNPFVNGNHASPNARRDAFARLPGSPTLPTKRQRTPGSRIALSPSLRSLPRLWMQIPSR
jgi:hypothetical protein